MRSFSYILFLSLICNFAYGQAIIKGINYDESKVPDFLLFGEGRQALPGGY